ncbi:hypothetical protein ACFOU2_14580 [Bacillus songklensis]|uniref:Uncharacterized protein n=1 Tax=Bacillus songklensis TaxID=1069116 RepID=A0ABV8B329_9BACI
MERKAIYSESVFIYNECTRRNKSSYVNLQPKEGVDLDGRTRKFPGRSSVGDISEHSIMDIILWLAKVNRPYYFVVAGKSRELFIKYSEQSV